MKEAATTRKVDYFRLPRPLWRKLKKHLPKKRRPSRRGGRPRASERAAADAVRYVLWTGRQWKAIHRDWFGVSSSVVHERFQGWRRTGVFEKLAGRMAEHYARERGGVGWRWQSMDSRRRPAPLGGDGTGGDPTDRGKTGAKINLMVDSRGAPVSVVLTGANRHDEMSAAELVVSAAPRRPAHKEQHLRADKAHDADDLREFAASAGYTAHIKPRANRKGAGRPPEGGSPKRAHPARRWIVERTISWLCKRRGLRARWAKKAANWAAFVQIARAHILLNMAVSG